MTSLKGTILGCITFLITVGVVIAYFSQQDRYTLYTHEKGIFVFDRKTATLNFCDSQICQMIRPVLPPQDAEVVMAGMTGVPAQNSIITGSTPVLPPNILPQGVVMQPMRQAYSSSSVTSGVTLPSQQTPIQIVSPLSAPNTSCSTAITPSTKPAIKNKKADKGSDSSDDNSDSTDDNSDNSDASDTNNDNDGDGDSDADN